MTGALWPSLLAPSQFGRPDLTAVAARGTRLTFEDGTTKLCATSGLWNTNLGYGNDAITSAVTAALQDAAYLTLFRYGHRYAERAADALVETAGSDAFARVLFSTSGGAANDLVMKLVRQYHALRGQPRPVIVGLRGSYHGLTFGSFALTGEDLGQRGYGVDQRLVRHVDPHDPAELLTLLQRQHNQIGAVVVEPVLGSGALPLSGEFVDTLLDLRDHYGFLVVADEVATGFGRTGDMFASQRWSRPPDVMLTSKGLTNGTCAAAAVLVSHQVSAVYDAADSTVLHGETQAGTPPTCAAILATISEMRRLDAVARARRVSAALDTELDLLIADQPLALTHRGVGCFRAVELATPDGLLPDSEIPAVVGAIRAAGAVVHPGPHGFQLIPALTYTDAEVQELFAAVRAGLADYQEHATVRPITVGGVR